MNHLTRSAFMALTWLALAGSASAQATNLPDGLQLSCDNTFTQLDGADLSLRCAGNLTLQGQVTLQRSGSITLEAGQDLNLSGLTLVAPTITLTTTSGRLWLNPDVVFNSGGTVTLNTETHLQGNLELRLATPGDVITQDTLPFPPGSLTVTAVPEPDTGLLGLVGAALALSWAFARGQHNRRP